MDDFSLGGEELREALRHLRRLNRLFAAAAPTLYGIEKLWIGANRPKRLTVLDVGSGSGDVNRRILKWADVRGIDVTITLADITEEACEEARLLFQDEPRIQIVRQDVFEIPDRSADIVTGTQFVHHFGEQELRDVVSKMMRIARIGVAVNDIHRHWIAWAAVWIAARLISRNRYIRHDGPLSVAKGFRKDDWTRLFQSLGVSSIMFSWRPLFRYAVVIHNKQEYPIARSGV